MNSSRQPNILVRLWLGFWRSVTALRIGVFNVLFLIVLALIIGVLLRGGEQLIVESDTTLIVDPRGFLVEEYTGTPIERALNEALGEEVGETRLRDILSALDRAAQDDRITQVLLSTDDLIGVSPGVMLELQEAFAEFRNSGKPVIAYGGFMGQGQYFLASLADEVWLDSDGLVLLTGYGLYRQYFAEGLERLAVDANLIRVGEYKSAMEPFIRSDMSEEAREASTFLLGDLWQRYVEMTARNRGLPVAVMAELTEQLPRQLEQANGDGARAALEAGLVDRLVSRPELRAEMAQRGAPDDNGSYRNIGFMSYLAASQPQMRAPEGQVGVIVAQGAITEGVQPPGTIGADSTSRLIRQALHDDDIKAVVLRVDSGGGSAFASEIIRRELMALREAGKPVVVSFGNVAASGGYWIAMGADEIWAYPSTITGSIGIFGFFPTFQDTLAKIGVYSDGVGTTPLSDAMRPDREMSDAMERLLQSFIEHGYREFIGLVAEHRRMSVEEVDAVAQGRVWSGAQAQERGLVDKLGTLDDAIGSAARMASLGEDYRFTYVEPKLEPWQQFLTQMGARAILAAGFEASHPLLDLLPADFRSGLLADLTQVFNSTQGGRPGVMAHCLCEAPR
ncbi:signal peptide peptidase SppA [Wenzhouxiangella limi]|uniref:Signal peptide peptidase SppA n=1 Tax=Wenzhouxiangella limi TaxID=2707351 RepID=A0A845V477_9GAMM|nr:signal peptide peptidase SppA [Wenzhouxiangella limi]NDY95996.1 signal peptide peptidase SppA [Wenzhouxiangella limi]